MKSFSSWSIEEVEEEFDIYPEDESTLLDEWIDVTCEHSEFELSWLEYIRAPLEKRSYIWNEQELIANFIAPLLRLVNFEQTAYRGFLVRELSISYKNEKLSGEVDFMVAQGRHSPKRYYFFLHEYKRETEYKDPLGQLMVAMVVAQILNQDEQPLYGAYVIGRMWFFVVLEGKAYTVHRGFNAATDEVKQILCVLKEMRTIIERMLITK
ncbi:MAG: hypothetical protein AAF639_12305 [Chloroflexota bacterium]